MFFFREFFGSKWGLLHFLQKVIPRFFVVVRILNGIFPLCFKLIVIIFKNIIDFVHYIYLCYSTYLFQSFFLNSIFSLIGTHIIEQYSFFLVPLF